MTEIDENIIENIGFSMKMEYMPLIEEDKTRLRICLNGNREINEVLQETIKTYFNYGLVYGKISIFLKMGCRIFLSRN